MINNARFETRRLVLEVISELPLSAGEILHRIHKAGYRDASISLVETALRELHDNEIIGYSNLDDFGAPLDCWFAAGTANPQKRRSDSSIANPHALMTSFLSYVCPACGRDKRLHVFLCRRCFFKLSWQRRDELKGITAIVEYFNREKRFSEFQAFIIQALKDLGVTTLHMPTPRQVTAATWDGGA